MESRPDGVHGPIHIADARSSDIRALKELSGVEPSKQLLAELKRRVDLGKALSAKHLGREKPCLAVVVVGVRSDFAVYTRNKKRVASQLGIDIKMIEFSDDVSGEDLRVQIRILNRDVAVDGIIVQLPLPAHLPSELLQEIDPAKDVDGLSYLNAGKLTLNGLIAPLFSPCTPRGIMHLLQYYGVELKGKHLVVIGRSPIVGKPLALMMLQEDATVTICHSHTCDVQSHALLADILVVATGGIVFNHDFHYSFFFSPFFMLFR